MGFDASVPFIVVIQFLFVSSYLSIGEPVQEKLKLQNDLAKKAFLWCFSAQTAVCI